MFLAVLLAVVSVGVLTVAPVAALAQSASPSPSGTVLRVGWTAEPDSLNPLVGASTSAYEVFGLNYDQLTGYNPADMSVRPQLATSWEHSADGKVWTFTIRKGVTWQDGQPLTARDVAFTYNFVIKNQVGKFTGSTTFIVPPVVAVDDYTVRFTCSKPKATMLSMSVPILPEHIWSKVPAKLATSTYQNKVPIVGSGPFQVVEWKKGSYVKLVANKHYWNGSPKIDGLLFEMYQNADTMTQDLKSGALDVAVGLLPMQYKQLTTDPSVTAITYPVVGFCELNTNCFLGKYSTGNPVLRDVRFRHALAYAIDRDKIAEVAFNGLARPATSLLQSDFYDKSLDWHWEPPADVKYTFDLVKAGQMLTQAGYPLKNGVRVDKRGKPITLRLWADTASAASQTTGKLIAGWLKQLKLGVSFEIMDEGALFDHVWNFKGNEFAPDFDLTLWTPWAGTVDPDWLLSILTTGQIGGWSATGWSNPQYDRLYEEQQTTLLPNDRKNIIWEMQKLLYSDVPLDVLVYPLSAEAYSNRWEGWVKFPANTGAVLYTNNNFDTYMSVHLKPAAAASGGSHAGAIAGGIIAAAVLAVGVWLLLRRRSRPQEG